MTEKLAKSTSATSPGAKEKSRSSPLSAFATGTTITHEHKVGTKILARDTEKLTSKNPYY
ncbi:hypothetical protein [Corynebacterium mastitidis]